MTQVKERTDSKSIENLEKLVDEALGLLSKERDQLVLAKRHGVKNFDLHTLEKIGEELGVTRERVRQIEKAAMEKIRNKREHKNNLSDYIKNNLSTIGGIIAFENLADSLDLSNQDKKHLAFLTKLDPKIIVIEKTDHFAPIVVDVDTYKEDDIHKLHDQLIEIVKTFGKPVKFDNIYKKVDGPHNKKALGELADSSKTLTCLDNNWGLKHWPEVNPKSIRDKIYLILKGCGRPMHFRQIAEQIEKLKANPKKVTTQAVHNELIKDSRFVLIGRGIYALNEWGYKPGTVSDVIEQILEKNSPLKKEEIIKKVLDQRKVKVTTIILNLQEKPQFEKVSKTAYRLKTE